MRTIEAAAMAQGLPLTTTTLQRIHDVADKFDASTGVIVLPDVAALAHRDRA
jgi:hypothetical protein